MFYVILTSSCGGNCTTVQKYQPTRLIVFDYKMEKHSIRTSDLIHAWEISGRDEMNLAELPIVTCGRSVKGSVVFEKEIRDRHGRTLGMQKWKVVPAMEYDPHPAFIESLLVTLISKTCHTEPIPKRVVFTPYGVLKIMRYAINGNSYRKLREALSYLKGITIDAEGIFWDNKIKEYRPAARGFNLIDEYFLWQDASDQERQKHGEHSYFEWSNVIWESLANNFIKKLDLDYYFGLKKWIAKKLYRLFDKWLYRQTELRVNVFELRDRLGMKDYRYASKIWEKIKPACEELQTTGFLQGYSYSKGILTVQKSRDFKDLPVTLKEEASIHEKLIAIGVEQKTAASLATEHSLEVILGEMKYVLTVPNVRNLAGLLVSRLNQIKADNERAQGELESKKQRLAEKQAEEKAQAIAEQALQNEVEKLLESLSADETKKLRSQATKPLEKGLKTLKSAKIREETILEQMRQVLRVRLQSTQSLQSTTGSHPGHSERSDD